MSATSARQAPEQQQPRTPLRGSALEEGCSRGTHTGPATISILTRLCALAAIVSLAACGGNGDYVKDGDTGAASPATTPTPDNPGAPDSTSGMSQRAGAPGASGTRQGTNGDSGIRSSSPASTAPSTTPKRP